MTYAIRCQHGELWAVCRECPDDEVSPWTRTERRLMRSQAEMDRRAAAEAAWNARLADALRPPETDEEPWTLERENRERSGLIAAGCVLALAALVVVAYLWGTR